MPTADHPTIANPILNRPFAEPTRHFRFDDQGITGDIVDSRRPSEYFVPIARPKKKGAGQLRLDADLQTEDRREENRLVNDIRRRIDVWRQGGYVGVTPTTRKLLQHWTDPDRERRLSPQFTEDSRMALTPQDVPTRTENSPAVGESVSIDLYKYRMERMAYVEFKLAERVLNRYFQDPETGALKHWLFPQLLSATRTWVRGYVTCKDEGFPQMLRIAELEATAADKIYAAIVRGDQEGRAPDEPPTLLPVLRPYDTIGSTRYVAFDTSKPVMHTDPEKCHLNYVVADTDTWEQKMAETLERLPQVLRYAKNQGLGFTIPYTLAGEERQYTPDFLVHLDDGHGPADPLNVILEVSGEARKDKTIKAETARSFWVAAINNLGTHGRWAYLNITDPWESEGPLLALTKT